ncbi:unnamed protein product [Protopolystoma xenopodis]|uniref:Uncharacterized protein n=1 Tax=Protopolystoma xenopodis TaxID=117903 RepID=A0A448XKH9_9PLAT|nr:unnamed protein product [Protopolystoma xenopodis]
MEDLVLSGWRVLIILTSMLREAAEFGPKLVVKDRSRQQEVDHGSRITDRGMGKDNRGWPIAYYESLIVDSG